MEGWKALFLKEVGAVGPNLAVCPGAAVLHLTHVTEKMSPHAPGCLNLKVPPKDSSDSYSGLNPLKCLALTL